MLQAAGSNSLVSLSDELMQSLAFQCIDYSVELFICGVGLEAVEESFEIFAG